MAGKGKAEEVYVASIDQGTTSTRFIIYDCHASPVASHHLEFKQHYPEAGVIRLGGWCRTDGPTTPTTCTSAPWRRPSCSSFVASSTTTTTLLPTGA
ncbi:glycerol kinase 1-like [Triticum urartu]|uniref:glycerol kinase 1-like n=1 Tax=Triticum urartu TaxID=4572 RepID=UPI002043BD34|nr:glycerol kinase 1-like [Triticum urartu]